MNNNKVLFGFAGLILSGSIFAGGMGPVEKPYRLTSYLGGEATVTWNQLGTYNINGATGTQSNQLWGGRFYGGLINPYNDILRFTGEMGGGYYGSTKYPARSGASNKKSIDGYDFLIGFLYKLNNYTSHDIDLMASVGVMAQNLRSKASRTLGRVVPGGSFNGTLAVNDSQTQILPEVKVGGIYNVNSNLGITVAYMHVFGSSPSGTFTGSGTPGTGATLNSSGNWENPTLNSILFGLRYNFA